MSLKRMPICTSSLLDLHISQDAPTIEMHAQFANGYDPGMSSSIVNIAGRLRGFAKTMPDRCAIAQHVGRNADGSYRYEERTFGELDAICLF